MARGGRLTVKGMDQLAKRLGALPEAVEKASRRATRAETEEVADDMRRAAPRLSGDLVRGIQAEMNEATITGQAVSTARHTPFVVHGTSDTPANDFMTPAAVRSRRRFPRRVTAEVKEELRRITG